MNLDAFGHHKQIPVESIKASAKVDGSEVSSIDYAIKTGRIRDRQGKGGEKFDLKFQQLDPADAARIERAVVAEVGKVLGQKLTVKKAASSLELGLYKLAAEKPEWRTRIAAVLKPASWSGAGPMDGDAPMDLMDEIDSIDPKKGVKKLERELKSKRFADRYSAMGVWDVVVSSGIEPWASTFSAMLSDDVKVAANKKIDKNDEWYQEVVQERQPTINKFLAIWKRGEASGGKIRAKFRPKKMKGAWYIASVDADEFGGTGASVTVQLRNKYTDEVKEWEETMVALPPRYRGIAADQRGYGGADPDVLIDATRGMGDFVDGG